MSRVSLFSEEPVDSISGLVGLTQPASHDRVAAVIDVAVVGARSDGKTQFIAHAIRTLRAYAPADLARNEVRQNQDILQVVMNARDPRPEATVPGQVRHYTFRARPENFLAGLGGSGRWRLLSGFGLGRLLLLFAVFNALLVTGCVFLLRDGDPLWSGVSGGLALVLGTLAAYRMARWNFRRAGEIEVVFWDVAGEQVYSGSASGYYTFLSTLAQTRAKKQPRGRRYGFAPVLICNPLSVGAASGDSSYARIRQLMPLFAALQDPPPPVLVAVNRWSLVKALCRPGSNAEDMVAVVPSALGADEEVAGESGTEAREPLPVVKRNVVREHCLDAERSEFSDTEFSTIHYDAGLHAELTEENWPGWDKLPKSVRSRWAEVGSAGESEELDRLVRYRYAEGPGAFEEKTRRSFLRWLASIPRHGDEWVDEWSEDEAPQPRDRGRRSTGELYVVSPVPDEPRTPGDDTTGGFRTGGA